MLTSIIGIDQHLAQGANLLFFVPTSVVAILINLKNKNIQLKTAFIVIITGIIGAIIGTKISLNLNVKDLKIFFGYFLIFIAINEIYSLIKNYIKLHINKQKS